MVLMKHDGKKIKRTINKRSGFDGKWERTLTSSPNILLCLKWNESMQLKHYTTSEPVKLYYDVISSDDLQGLSQLHFSKVYRKCCHTLNLPVRLRRGLWWVFWCGRCWSVWDGSWRRCLGTNLPSPSAPSGYWFSPQIHSTTNRQSWKQRGKHVWEFIMFFHVFQPVHNYF